MVQHQPSETANLNILLKLEPRWTTFNIQHKQKCDENRTNEQQDLLCCTAAMQWNNAAAKEHQSSIKAAAKQQQRSPISAAAGKISGSGLHLRPEGNFKKQELRLDLSSSSGKNE